MCRPRYRAASCVASTFNAFVDNLEPPLRGSGAGPESTSDSSLRTGDGDASTATSAGAAARGASRSDWSSGATPPSEPSPALANPSSSESASWARHETLTTSHIMPL